MQYIYIESSMNGFIKFEVKELKKKRKNSKRSFQKLLRKQSQILIEEFICIRR